MRKRKCCALWVAVLLLQTIVAQTTVCSFINQQTGAIQKMNYSLSRVQKEDNIFYSDYYVLDNNKLPFKIISVANNTVQQTINITLRNKTGEVEEQYPVNYNNYSGLILTEAGDSITRLDKEYRYIYLLSFDDPSKQYVSVHYLTKLSSYAVLFNRVSDSLLTQNKDFLKQASLMRTYVEMQQAQQKAMEEKRKADDAYQRKIDSLVDIKVKASLAEAKNRAVLQATKVDSTSTPVREVVEVFSKNPVVNGLDSLFRQFKKDSLRVEKIWIDINQEIKKHNSEDFDIKDESRFVGNNRDGNWQGSGLMIVANRKIYMGVFDKGQFVKGVVYLRLENGVRYTGEYENARPWGFGQFTYANNDVSIGYFGENAFEHGITRKTDKDGNYYFGQLSNNKKEGYGIYVSSKGNQYMGEFQNDKLQNGYSSETDDVGTKTFFVIDQSIKKAIGAEEWQTFFQDYAKIKAKNQF